MVDDTVYVLVGKLAICVCALIGAVRALAMLLQVLTWLVTGQWVPYR